MPKSDNKKKVVLKERIEDNHCDLSLSELTEVPVREIATFKRVTVLDLSNNYLSTLGKNFSLLTRLVRLDLSRNQLKYLPEDFGKLVNLRHLNLYGNNLQFLPLSLGSLKQLRYLDLQGNPLIPALAEVAGFCTTTKECQAAAKNTVQFMARMQAEAERTRNQLFEDVDDDTKQQGELQEDGDGSGGNGDSGGGGGGDSVANSVVDVFTGGDDNANDDEWLKPPSRKSKKNRKSKQQKVKDAKAQQQHMMGNGGSYHNTVYNNMETVSYAHEMESRARVANGVEAYLEVVNHKTTSTANSKAAKKKANGGAHKQGHQRQQHQGQLQMHLNHQHKHRGNRNSITALHAIFIFFILLAVNVGAIYLIMFKHPEIAESIIEAVPPQYRDWLWTKTEFLRLHVSDWISEFRTSPLEQ